MKKPIKFILTAFLVAVFPNIFSEDLTKARAISTKHSVSNSYANSIYYKNLTSLELTDDQATNTVLVALSQVGYHEGNSKNELNGYNQNGSKNFVEYTKVTGALSGYQNDGYAYAWCASFVSWSLTHASVPKSAYGGNAPGCHTLIENLKKTGASINTPQKYSPQTGDLIFFKNSSGSNAYSHVGLVIYSDNEKVYTVEGNASQTGYNGAGGVVKKSYSLNYSRISAYATPKYLVGENAVDFSKNQLGRYFITADALNIRNAPNGNIIGKAYKGDYTIVTGFINGFAQTSFNGKTAYVSSDYITYLHKNETVEVLPEVIPPIVEETPPTTEILPPVLEEQLPSVDKNDTTVLPEITPTPPISEVLPSQKQANVKRIFLGTIIVVAIVFLYGVVSKSKLNKN